MAGDEVFSIFSNGTRIGRSALELGDPPMGVAFGRFIAEEGFASLLDQKPSIDERGVQRWGGLAVRTSTDIELKCADVILERYYHALGTDMEITVYGVAYPSYEDLFPQICLSYEESLRDT